MLRTDLHDNFDELQIGDWFFKDAIGPDEVVIPDAYIALRLHEGERGFAILPIATWASHIDSHGQACWRWDGNKEAPTLSPSILHWGGGKGQPATWHGYLRAGKLETV